ncbi:MAG: hypothetical protein K9J27_03315 [Bacteroidales bacterium]|nr:hypothetical protein [Bacteroidales bacterium]MCF8332804.1 hypothetical protein [Bacteroidales bacterium]
MARTFSFAGSPIRNVLERAHDMLPSIEKVLAVYYDDKKDGLRISLAHRASEGVHIEEVNTVDVMDKLKSFREKATPISWLHHEDIPFKIEKRRDRKIEVFEELENTVLLLRFENETDQKSDLLFYYFNGDTSNFGVSLDNRALTTELKSIISHILYHAVKSQIREHKENQEKLKLLNQNTRYALHENKELKEELENTHHRYRQSLADLCLQYVKEISAEYNTSFKLSPAALDKLINYKGDINNVRLILEQAAFFASTVHIDEAPEGITIEDSYINTENLGVTETVSKSDTDVSIREQRYTKTKTILDDMEQAAQRLKDQNQKLTSNNLARSLPHPKSAAAISDQLNKHRDRIIKLFDEHPEDWALIRKSFRPIQNIMNS